MLLCYLRKQPVRYKTAPGQLKPCQLRCSVELTAAVTANTSTLRARVASFTIAAKRMVNTQTLAKRADISSMKYNAIIELIGAIDASTVPKNSTAHKI